MDNLEKIRLLNKFENEEGREEYQAAIVEDEEGVLTYLRNSLSKAFEPEGIKMAFDVFLSGEGFLEMMNDHYHYDIIFLDIEMPGIDGIEVCRRVRSLVPDSLVVFISGKDELVFQTFEVQPFRFIRKSQYDQQLSLLVKACADQLRQRNRSIVRLIEPKSGDIYSFDVNKVKYIEALGRSCSIVTETETVTVNSKFMELEQIFSKYTFLKPHRSYLVNSQYIFHIGKNSLRLADQTEIPVSRNKVEEIKQAFLKLRSR